MRLFKTAQGGSPLYLDDLKFIADGLDQYLGALVDGYGDNFTIKGAEINDGGTSWDNSAGFIVLGGQICKVTAGSVIKPNTSQSPEQDAQDERGTYWEIIEDDDTDGSRTLLTGSTFTPWTTRKARLRTSNTVGAYSQGSTGWHYTTVKTLDQTMFDLIKAKIKPYLIDQWVDDFVAPGDLLNGWTFTAPGGNFVISKDLNNWIRIWATIDGSSATSSTFYTLPSDFLPVTAAEVAGGAYRVPADSGGLRNTWVRIETNGDMIAPVTGLSQFSFNLVYLGG